MIQLSTQDEDTRLEAMEALMRLMGSKFNKDTVPSVLGHERGVLIASITQCLDPYQHQKRVSNEKALHVLGEVERLLEEAPEEERLRLAVKASCLGNVLDFDLPDSDPNLENALSQLSNPLYIDHTDKFKELIETGKRLLYLTDNAGEIAFDTLLVKELRRLGAHVTVAVKDGPPSLNDALMEDALAVGMDKAADEVTTTGVSAIGVRLDLAPQWFIDLYEGSDLIVAKGMANWETMTETPAPSPTLYVLRTKCEPVARAVGAPVGESVALLVPRGWKL